MSMSILTLASCDAMRGQTLKYGLPSWCQASSQWQAATDMSRSWPVHVRWKNARRRLYASLGLYLRQSRSERFFREYMSRQMWKSIISAPRTR